jgi:hypothetical protein
MWVNRWVGSLVALAAAVALVVLLAPDRPVLAASPACKPGHSRCPSPSPTPTATSPSPSPSPTPTSTAAACVTSDLSGGCPAGGAYTDPSEITNSNGFNTYVTQNVFGTVQSQTLTAYSPSDWKVTANSTAGDTSVESYPDTQQLYQTSSNTPDPLSRFATLTGTETESMPHNSGTIAEAAWDLWTNYTSDIMVWNDNVNRCNSGAQGTLLAASQTVSGQTYDVYRYGGTGGEIIFSEQGAGGTGTCAQDPSSSVDILAFLSWVNSHVTPITGVSQIQYGFELCSTGGTAEDFAVSALTIRDTCTGGGTGCQT